MLKVRLIITIVTAVFLVTQSSLFSQEKAITGSSEYTIDQTGKDQNPHNGIFKLHNIKQTQFDNTTIIQFELGEEANVQLTVYNSDGIIIETLIDDLMDAGVYNIHFKSAEKIIAGELTYKLEVKGISGVKNVFAVK
ncbi:MAG TPA: hypothetical protein PKC91_15050 [Ignavibacteria bacterium]|nr:hypothetical protein [Ignavibacteria bacterium]